MKGAFSLAFLFPNVVSGIINIFILLLLVVAAAAAMKTMTRYNHMENTALERVQKIVNDKLESLDTPAPPPAENKTANESQYKGDTEKVLTDDVKQVVEEAAQTAETGEKEKKRDKNTPDLLMDANELLEYVSPESIISKRIYTIERMRKYRVKINAEFLQQAALTSENSRLGISLPRFASNIAMILGLFGTFIGLALMVTKISMLMPNPGAADLSVSTLKSSIADMDTVFQGIKTAFSTSIVGIFTTLVCLMLNYRVRRRQTAFFHELETFTIEKLIPVLVPPVESEHLMEEVSFQLQDSFNTLNNIVTQNNQTLNHLNTVETSFKSIVDEVKDITRREESKNYENVMGLLADNNKTLLRLVDTWPKMAAAMKDHSKLAENKIDTLVTAMKNQQNLFDREFNRVLQVRKGGVMLNFPSLTNVAIILSAAVILTTVLIMVL